MNTVYFKLFFLSKTEITFLFQTKTHDLLDEMKKSLIIIV